MKRSTAELIRPDIIGMPAYKVADATGYIKLDAMENPFSLPPELRMELGERLAEVEVNRYPDADCADLKQGLACAFGIPEAARVLLGNGSDEIISMVTQAISRPGARVMALEPSFVMYRLNARFSRLDYLGVPLNSDFSLNLPATLAAIREHQPEVIFISYPNNPTGNRFARADVEAILAEASGLVVVDEAYSSFSDDSLMDLAGHEPNLLVMRTVSKLGLAGIRLGYAASTPAWIEALNTVRPPYNVNLLTQETARFMLDHLEVFNVQTRTLCSERARLAQRLSGIRGLEAYPSEANFITVRVPDAGRVFAALKEAGILVKNLHGAHALLANCLRLSIGTPNENDALFAALTTCFN